MQSLIFVKFGSISTSNMSQKLIRFGSKIETKSKLEFRNPNFEIFGDLLSKISSKERNPKSIFHVGDRPAERGRIVSKA